MKIGILRETKVPADSRVPLTPGQCRLIEEKFNDIRIFVQPSTSRCFPDSDYTKEGITVREDLSDCTVFLGVKEVAPETLIPAKTYLFFSHTIKKQEHNRRLLKAILDRRIRLIDYELLTDNQGIRIIGFGRWAGLIGSYMGIRALCIRGGLLSIPQPTGFINLRDMVNFARIFKLPPVKVVITGDGRVGKGACEMMDAFRIKRISADEFIGNSFGFPVYTQLGPGLYNKSKDGSPFDLQDFFKNPGRYDSDFDRFCNTADLLIAAAYWDPGAPVLFTRQRITDPGFTIRVIADISCDLNGSIPSTIQTSAFSDPYYDYNPLTGKAEPPFSGSKNITVMAIDNLPCGLPAEASFDFGQTVIKNILPLLIGDDKGGILERATIARGGNLTAPYGYLHEWALQTEQQL